LKCVRLKDWLADDDHAFPWIGSPGEQVSYRNESTRVGYYCLPPHRASDGGREKTCTEKYTVVNHLGTDDNAMAAGGAVAVLLLVGIGAVGVTGAAAGAAAVELDALATAGDAVALARAGRGDGRWGRAVGTGRAGRERWDIRAVRVVIGVIFGVVLGVVLEGLLGEAGVEGLKGGLGVVTGNDMGGLAWTLGLGGADGRGRERAALGDDARVAAGRALGGGGSSGLGSWDIEDVELTAGGGLRGVLAGWVVGDLVAVEHVVEPVTLAWLEDRGLEAEGTLPGALGAGKRELSLVAVPGSDEVDGLDRRSGAESKGELSSGHCEILIV